MMNSMTVCVSQYRWGRISIDQAVRQLAQRGDGGFSSLEEVARVLCMSSRTLRRRLQKAGLTYRMVTESIRRSRGQELLCSGSGSIEAVAVTTGYSTPANFYRAFQRWNGMTPGRYRRQATQSQVAACEG